MSSSSQSSSSLPVHDCIAPLVDFDPQEKFILPHATELNSEITGTLIQKLSENETQNTNLRKKILEREKQIKELSSMLQCEKVNTQKGNHLSRSIKEVQAHLQCQIQRKEVKNDELKVKIQTLEKKIAEWKHQAGEYKRQKSALKETSEQNKIALKKAMRSQKQRAQFFEEAAKNLTSKIREHEAKLCEIWSSADVWKNQHDRMIEEKTMLEVQTEDLKNQITSLLEELERRKEWRRHSEEEILAKLNYGNSENEKIYYENEKLKASIATLEKSTVSVEHELLHLQEKAKLQENLVEQHKNEVQKLQIEVEELKSRYERVLNENKKITENKCSEVAKVRDRAEAELKELEHVCDLLKAAEEKQTLMFWERIHAQKCEALRKLQVQSEYEFSSAFFFCDISFNGRDDNSVTSMGSLSLEEENCNIQRKYEELKRQLGKMEFQNEELACQLRTQDQSLQYSKLKLEEKIAEYNALTRQLESALEKGRKMVAEEQEKMSYREQAFQIKLLVLENEVREGKEEKNQLLAIFHHNEKHHEVCLKELENSLQKSENRNQSIQNYVQFLKAAYVTMFG
ncbi:protein BCAP [Empidonax traillii]|uniref:protein BCAP n=1 Tax=Empidonax traillii TaxID=164674 RepID=UPI000FFD15ED|nr:protein BCAP [Empidonax traillii]